MLFGLAKNPPRVTVRSTFLPKTSHWLKRNACAGMRLRRGDSLEWVQELASCASRCLMDRQPGIPCILLRRCGEARLEGSGWKLDRIHDGLKRTDMLGSKTNLYSFRPSSTSLISRAAKPSPVSLVA